MSPPRLAAVFGTVVLAGWVAGGVGWFVSSGIEHTGAPIEGSRTTSATAGAEPIDAPQATAMGEDGVSVTDVAIVDAALPDPRPMPRPEPSVQVAAVDAALPDSRPMPRPETSSVQVAAVDAALPDPRPMPRPETSSVQVAIVDAALPDPRPMPRPETSSVQVATASTPDPVQSYATDAVRSIETPDECLVIEICIDRYLWSVYQRAPKVDTIKVPERIKVTVKKKGKTRIVTKTVIRLVDENFTWKDPKAAQKAGMSLMDYVIGGMDRSFKLKLYHALRAMDEAGLSPGITSGFRDDYRQLLASGNKAATDSSYHGGSRRGGYGHGLAADLVSVKGETRAQRWISSENVWKWIDAHGKEFGIGRPYLDKDPPHVGPIDGKEYAEKRGLAHAQRAGLETNSPRSAVRNDHSRTNRPKTALSKIKSI